jgi:ribose 5-phosphate isomerase B
MKIAIGADHAGFRLKESLRAALAGAGHEVADFGTHSAESTDFPDYAKSVSDAVAKGEAERGVLVCMTGMGMTIAANKVKGIRAALGFNPEEVRYTRLHNNANVLAFGARYTSEEAAREMLDIFLSTGFEGGRHERRVNKIMAIEEGASEGEQKG